MQRRTSYGAGVEGRENLKGRKGRAVLDEHAPFNF